MSVSFRSHECGQMHRTDGDDRDILAWVTSLSLAVIITRMISRCLGYIALRVVLDATRCRTAQSVGDHP
jgi:hypothetical protein